MRRGFSLAELAAVLAIVSVLAAAALPRARAWLDWAAVDRAAVEITTALALARHAAVMGGSRAHLLIAADSLRLDRWGAGAWQPYTRWAGPAHHGVAVELSNPEVVFIPTGMAWGLSNSRIVLRRGTKIAILTVSRVGRVKRW